MALTEEDKNRLKHIVKYWGDIQAEIKRAEQISRLSIGPSINELRYAGRILVSALVKELDPSLVDLSVEEDELTSSQKMIEKIAIAEQYLMNADNDISDALFYFFQKRADDINARYGAKAVIERSSAYGVFLKNLDMSRNLIIESRRDTGRRKENYKNLKPIREKLIKDYFEVQKADALMAIEIKKHVLEKNRLKALVLFLGIALCFSIFFLFIYG
jgi:hypothetical protein